MKHLLQLFILLIFFIATSCKKDELPTPTEEGKQTLGCRVNGKLFVAQRKSMWQLSEEISANVQERDGIMTLYIRGTDSTIDGEPSIYLLIDYDRVQQGVTYSFNDPNTGIASAEYKYHHTTTNSTEYITSQSLFGELKFTLLDKDKNIASGTFSFDAEDSQGEKVEVREGRFDVLFDK